MTQVITALCNLLFCYYFQKHLWIFATLRGGRGNIGRDLQDSEREYGGHASVFLNSTRDPVSANGRDRVACV